MSNADVRDLLHALGEFGQVQVAVLGDPMFDVYHFGRVERISPEAPVPVFIQERQERRYGGAANVVNQLQALGCRVRSFFPDPDTWCVKERYLVGHQQLFRVDTERVGTRRLERPLDMGDFDVLVVSDYDKGWVTFERCQAYIQAARNCGIPVVVDPKGTSWSKYAGANAICPNEKERQALTTMTAPIFPLEFRKLGPRGIQLIADPEIPGFQVCKFYPAQAAHVYDVTGAGDTVTAVVAACLGSGSGPATAARLANLAAGVVVGEVGTSVCTLKQLQARVEAL